MQGRNALGPPPLLDLTGATRRGEELKTVKGAVGRGAEKGDGSSRSRETH